MGLIFTVLQLGLPWGPILLEMCPINNRHSTPQGRGVKSGEGGYEGKRAREECVASGKRGAEMRGELENEKCREFSYSHI